MSTPYQVSARDYLNSGWSPIPLPINGKWPPPDGFTGAAGAYVNTKQLGRWLVARARYKAGNLSSAPGNVALRLPRNVIGVDVDAYGEKAGEATLAAAERDWGPLPPTWVVTSRTDGTSGIRLYRVPEGLGWPGQLPQGGGVELLRWDHRYAIVAPSVHPDTGDTYAWYLQELRTADDSAGMPSGVGEVKALLAQPDSFPEPADLPELPAPWVEGLTEGRNWKERDVNAGMGAGEVRDWLAAQNLPEEPCSTMRSTITKYTRAIRIAGDDGGAHDVARDAAWAVIGDAGDGHCGVVKALAELRATFISNVAKRRGKGGDGERLAKEEWARIVVRGVQKVSAEGNSEVTDPCTSLKALGSKAGAGSRASSGSAGRGAAGDSGSSNSGGDDGSGVDIADFAGGSSVLTWRLDDVGNAERLIRTMDGRARYSDGLGGWVLWDGKTWRLDTDRQIDRWSVKAVNVMEQELSYLEGDASAELIKAFKAHKKSSGKVGALRAMQEVAKGRKGITVPGELFDSRPELLGCGNGTVVLKEDGVLFRPSFEDDYLTLNTGTDYIPEAWGSDGGHGEGSVGSDGGDGAKLWADFLERFQPDPEVRTWLQKLVGYSLLGRNSKRFLVVCYGPTSTGKTTFGEAIRAALGGYAKDVNLSIFRDNQDERARPDLVEALPRRVVFAEEVSAQWHMHPDQIKRITGGAPIVARRPFAKTYVELVPAFTPWLLTNAAPTIEGGDEALVRRIKLVPWTETIAQNEEDPDYLYRLQTEAREAILSWAVAGYIQWRTAAGDIGDIPVGAMSANTEFRDELSDLDRFLADATVRSPELRAIPMNLFEAYERWCDLNRIPNRDRMTMTLFGRQLNGKGHQRKQLRVDGQPTWFRTGIDVDPRWLRVVT